MRTRNVSPFDAVIGRNAAPSCVETTRTELAPADERANLIDARAVNPHTGPLRRPVFLAFKEPVAP
jgi:hypothetical protein